MLLLVLLVLVLAEEPTVFFLPAWLLVNELTMSVELQSLRCKSSCKLAIDQ
jgi:hypothetical protein